MPTIIIFIIAILSMILSMVFFPNIKIGKLKIGTYWIITLLCAIVFIAIGSVSFENIKECFTKSDGINPLEILVLFFSMTFISVFLDELGLFSFLARKATKLASNNQISIFVILYILISILTVFTSNDVIILTFTPFICELCKRMKVNPVPYLFGEFVAANTLSMTLIIGNPTNIYLALSCDIDFLNYLKVMGPIAFIAATISALLLILIFNKDLKKPIEKEVTEETLDNKPLVIINSVILLACTGLMAVSNYIDIPMWLVSLCFAGLLLIVTIIHMIVTKNTSFMKSSLKRLPYELVPFLLSMFIIVIGLDSVGFTESLHNVLESNVNNYSYGFASLLTVNLMNNIPMSIFFSSVVGSDPASIYATIISSNLGAIITPLGSLAGIMWLSILKKNEIDFSFIKFVKYGLLIGIPSAIISLSMLFIIL